MHYATAGTDIQMIDVIIVGHSHVNCVRSLAKRAPIDAPAPTPVVHLLGAARRHGITNAETVTSGTEHPAFHPGIHAEIGALASSTGRNLCVSMIGGNEHNMLGLLRPPTPFDFVLPSRPDLPPEPGVPCIPYDCLKTELAAFARTALQQIAALAHSFAMPVIHMESPAPVSDDDFVASSIPATLRNARPDAPIAPRALRYKLWRLHSQIIAETCRANGVSFIPVPPQSLDEDGFLRPEYRANDPTHANENYARHLLRQIADVAADRAKSEART